MSSAVLFLKEHRQPVGPFETDFDAHPGPGREVQHQHLAPARADDVRRPGVARGALDEGRALSTGELDPRRPVSARRLSAGHHEPGHHDHHAPHQARAGQPYEYFYYG